PENAEILEQIQVEIDDQWQRLLAKEAASSQD
ncbi:hypothetical protein LCGC14_0992440, partial [marine sediment metagenome]